MGVDYSNGDGTNQDLRTGIRYGVISNHSLSDWAWDEIQIHGTDKDWENYQDAVLQDLQSAISGALEDTSATGWDAKALAQEILDGLDFDRHEGTGDCPRYRYEKDGYIIETCGDGDWFIVCSPFYAMAEHCSPCAPGAGHLETSGNVKTYALGPDWFDSDSPMPYKVHPVAQEVSQ